MKKLLLVLFMAGCAAQASDKQPDAGVNTKSSVYIENRIKWIYAKYYPACVRGCFRNTYSAECPDKCQKDFKQITKALMMSIRDNNEDDFDDMMESWYGHQ